MGIVKGAAKHMNQQTGCREKGGPGLHRACRKRLAVQIPDAFQNLLVFFEGRGFDGAGYTTPGHEPILA